MKIERQQDKDCMIIALEGELSMDSSVDLKNEIDQLANDPNLKGVVLNFEKVACIDSAGLGTVVSIFKHLLHHQKKLILSALAGSNYDVFSLTKLDQILTLAKNNQDALAMIAEG